MNPHELLTRATANHRAACMCSVCDARKQLEADPLLLGLITGRYTIAPHVHIEEASGTVSATDDASGPARYDVWLAPKGTKYRAPVDERESMLAIGERRQEQKWRLIDFAPCAKEHWALPRVDDTMTALRIEEANT